jgi:hypothetical protein
VTDRQSQGAIDRIRTAPAARQGPRISRQSRRILGNAASPAPDHPWGGPADPTRKHFPGEGVAKQQKCGTCRFFQEAGLAGSGWCHHPDRKTSSDVMIMVRRSELACRDDWSRSLWQPATGGNDDSSLPFSRSPLTGPMPPTSPEDLSTLLAQDIVSSADSGEDVLLSEARIISESPEAKNRWETPARAIQMPNFDPRTAIFRAREAYRDKVKAKASEARLLSAAEPIAEPVPEPVADWPECLESVAEYQQPEIVLPAPLASRDMQASIEPARSTLPVAANITPAPRQHVEDKPLATRSGSQNAIGKANRPRVQTPIVEPPADSAVAARALIQSAERADEAVRHEVRLAVDLPDWYRTDLPRICRTCRDYRPSADGMRGWCANGWAFTHRRLVQSDDAAPCHSAIGDWWAPVDDVWLVAADVSSHGRATPHLDRIAGQETARRRRSK